MGEERLYFIELGRLVENFRLIDYFLWLVDKFETGGGCWIIFGDPGKLLEFNRFRVLFKMVVILFDFLRRNI